MASLCGALMGPRASCVLDEHPYPLSHSTVLTGSVPLVLMKLNLGISSIDPGVLGAMVSPEFACFHFTYRPAGVTGFS